MATGVLFQFGTTPSSIVVLARFRYLTCVRQGVEFNTLFAFFPSRGFPSPRAEVHVIASEKRSGPRYLLRIPLCFRCFEFTCTDAEISTHSENISRSGLFMASPHRLRLGSSLSMTLQVPTEMSGSAFSEIRCMGRVVHEQGLSNGMTGYGVAIEKIVFSVQYGHLNGPGDHPL